MSLSPSNSPFFSVIVPCYNVANYICSALDSIIDQDFYDWESICVDDGSTDATLSLLQKYEGVDKRIHVLSQSNGGVSTARNKALELARGRFILFLDGDDAFAPGTMAYLHKVITEYKVDLVKFGHVNVSYNQCEGPRAVEIHEIPESCAIETYDCNNMSDLHKAAEKIVGTLIAWNGCVRRESVAGLAFLQIPNGEDIVWGVHEILRVRRLAVSSAKLYRYLLRPGSAVRTVSLRHLRSSLTAIECIANSTVEHSRFHAIRDVVFRRVRSILLGYAWPLVKKLPAEERNEAIQSLLAVGRRVFVQSGLTSGLQRVYHWLATRNALAMRILLSGPFDLAIRIKRIKGAVLAKCM